MTFDYHIAAKEGQFLADAAVRRDEHRTPLVTAGDKLKEEMGRIGHKGQISA